MKEYIRCTTEDKVRPDLVMLCLSADVLVARRAFARFLCLGGGETVPDPKRNPSRLAARKIFGLLGGSGQALPGKCFK